ncbi:unnamed protein product, partial [Closterium sp. NIES-54]
SSCEVEIYTGAMAPQELRWLTYLLTDLGEQPRSPPFPYVDKKAMLALCREHRLEHRTKHIALRYFLARELQQRGQLRLAYVASQANTADIFTKALAAGDHQRFCTLLDCVVFLLVPNILLVHSFPVSSHHAHQQSGVAERLNRTLQEKMRALLSQAQLGPLYWPFAMDHATLLHNLLSSSSLPNNASPHLLWTGKLGTTKLLRVFGCLVQYRPPTAPLGKFDQRAKWGLHLGIEKQYSAWRIMDYCGRLLVPARDCIFYENLTLPIFEQHLASQQNPASLFHGVRSFANADVELAASEEPDSDGAREAAPNPPVPVTSSGIPEFIPLADAAPEAVREIHHTYLVDEQRQPMPVVSDNSIRVNLDEIGGASGDQNDSVNFAGRTDDNPHYQTGLQILGLAASVQVWGWRVGGGGCGGGGCVVSPSPTPPFVPTAAAGAEGEGVRVWGSLGSGIGVAGVWSPLPILLLSFPLLQLPLGGGCEGVGEPGEWHWGGRCETNQQPSRHLSSLPPSAAPAALWGGGGGGG